MEQEETRVIGEWSHHVEEDKGIMQKTNKRGANVHYSYTIKKISRVQEKTRQDRCPHQATIIDAATDTVVCLECGLVLAETPSLSEYQSSAVEDTSHSIPRATRACLADIAARLSATPHQFTDAARMVTEMRATSRHPAAIAACVLDTFNGPICIRDAAAALDIPLKVLTRAVSRHQRRKNKILR
jgi:hypothetical protein